MVKMLRRRRFLAPLIGPLALLLAGAAPSSAIFIGGATPPKGGGAQPYSYVAQNLAGVYQATVIVTGSDRRYRNVGFARALRTVLVKVSGNPRLHADPRVDRWAREANLFVGSFDYVDQLAAYNVKDDQGTYDRPFNLTVHFVPAMIDGLLADLGDRPWRGERPLIVPVLAVRGVRAAYLLSAEVPAGADQRGSLEEVASELGLRVGFPTDAELAQWRVTMDGFPSPNVTPPADWALVAGTLAFQQAVPGWAGSWTMRYQGRDYTWGIRGVSFDAAFRNLARGVVRIASGHGAPG
jgi:uncharacterized protein